MFYLLSLSKKGASKWILLHWSFIEAYTDLLGFVTACKSYFLLRPMSLSEVAKVFLYWYILRRRYWGMILIDLEKKVSMDIFTCIHLLYITLKICHHSVCLWMYIWVYPASWLSSYCQVLLKSMHWSVHAIALWNWAKCNCRPMWKTSTIIKTS